MLTLLDSSNDFSLVKSLQIVTFFGRNPMSFSSRFPNISDLEIAFFAEDSHFTRSPLPVNLDFICSCTKLEKLHLQHGIYGPREAIVLSQLSNLTVFALSNVRVSDILMILKVLPLKLREFWLKFVHLDVTVPDECVEAFSRFRDLTVLSWDRCWCLKNWVSIFFSHRFCPLHTPTYKPSPH